MRLIQLLVLAAILLVTPLAGQERQALPVDIENPVSVFKALAEEYPALLRDAGIEDSVLVEFAVAADGEVQETKIVRASDHDALNTAALKVAKMVVFTPARERRIRRIRVELRFLDSRSSAQQASCRAPLRLAPFGYGSTQPSQPRSQPSAGPRSWRGSTRCFP